MSRLKIYNLATATWEYAGGANTGVLATAIAADPAFTAVYPRVINHAATASTARNGTAPIFWIGSVNPTNATDNDELYRTDLTAKYVRVSGAWIEVGSTRFAPISAPLGRIGSGSSFDNPTSGTTQLIVGTTASIPISAGRKYMARIELNSGHYGTVVADLFTIFLAMDGALYLGGPPVYIRTANQYMDPGSAAFSIAPSAGSHTFAAGAYRNAGTGSLQFRGRVYIYDEGA